MSHTVFNGVDFNDKRFAMLKKISTLDSFFNHYSGMNKRLPLFENNTLEHLSLFQVQLFQSRFEQQLNAEYLQNATFICTGPSQVIGSELLKNKGFQHIREMLIKTLLEDDCEEFQDVLERLERINNKLTVLERNFENVFLVASGETLKKIGDYNQLRIAIEDIIQARDQKSDLKERYNEIVGKIEIISEVSQTLY